MNNKVRYWGSVQFYKHLILMVTALIILTPSIGFLIMFAWNWKLKQDYNTIINEQMLYISQLEERLSSCQAENPENAGTAAYFEEKESQHDRNTANEVILPIPFPVDTEDWKYCLVNDSHPLPENYQPDLIDAIQGKQVHRGIVDALEQMLNAAEREGHNLIICSAYRDYEKQAELVENSINKLVSAGYSYTEAHWKTRQQLALTGVSEHHTGLAVDIVGKTHQSLDEKQADTPEAKWLEEHAHEYGFILRYPKDKEEITGIFFESWHFRYVGEEAASFIKRHQLCLEEFLELAEKQSE